MALQENKQVIVRKVGLDRTGAEPRPTSDFCEVQGKNMNRGWQTTQRNTNKL